VKDDWATVIAYYWDDYEDSLGGDIGTIVELDPMDPLETAQNNIGDCWLLATYNRLLLDDGERQLLRKNARYSDLEDGYYVKIYDAEGEPVEVFVDQVLPEGVTVKNGDPGIISVYESAVAQVYGENHLDGDSFHEGIRIFTGQTDGFKITASTNKKFEHILANNDVMYAASQANHEYSLLVKAYKDSLFYDDYENIKIVPNHGYTVVGYQDDYIGLINPWGPDNPADGGGVFWVSKDDFKKAFYYIYSVTEQ
jgi:hypothetical protein